MLNAAYVLPTVKINRIRNVIILIPYSNYFKYKLNKLKRPINHWTYLGCDLDIAIDIIIPVWLVENHDENEV